jgi:hypothetical protein
MLANNKQERGKSYQDLLCARESSPNSDVVQMDSAAPTRRKRPASNSASPAGVNKRPHDDADGELQPLPESHLLRRISPTHGGATSSPVLAAEAASVLGALGGAMHAAHTGRDASPNAATMEADAVAVSKAGIDDMHTSPGSGEGGGRKGGKRKAQGASISDDKRPPASTKPSGKGPVAAPKGKAKPGGAGSSSGSSSGTTNTATGGSGSGGFSASAPTGGRRRVTRGAVPEFNKELEQLMATAPVAPPEGWVQNASLENDEGSTPTTWEGWESRLRYERVPGYVISDLWHRMRETIQTMARECDAPADVHRTLTVGELPRSAPTPAAASAAAHVSSSSVGNTDSPRSTTLHTTEGVAREMSWEELLTSVAADIPYDLASDFNTVPTDLQSGDPGDGEPSDLRDLLGGVLARDFNLASVLAGDAADATAPSAAAPASGPLEGGAADTTPAAAASGTTPRSAQETPVDPGAVSTAPLAGPVDSTISNGSGEGDSAAATSSMSALSASQGGDRTTAPVGAPSTGDAAALRSPGSGPITHPNEEENAGPNFWARDLCDRLKRMLSVGATPLNFSQLYYLLMGTLAGHVRRLKPHMALPAASGGRQNKAALIRSNIAHHAVRRAKRLADELMDAFLLQCRRTARCMRLEVPLAGGAIELRRAMRSVLEVGNYGEYEVMSKPAFNELIGQKELWRDGERTGLLKELCTRDGETWITEDFFIQHTSKATSEVYVLVHLPSRSIVGLAAVADFQTPWTAGQFHHMAHACQEDRMFYFGRKSEKAHLPKGVFDMSSSFEGGTRWTSHFHFPSLLVVDIICAKPGVRGLAHILLAHLMCITSLFTADRTHVLFDISGREKNTRMIKFTLGIGANRCQTFTDEARSEGYVGVEGDDPSIYWTYPKGPVDVYGKCREGFGADDGKTSGVYAIDVELGESIGTEHPAVLFNDRVTLADFQRGNKNCSYFAIAPLDVAQQRLTAVLAALRVKTLEGATASGAAPPQRPWQRSPAAVPTEDHSVDSPAASSASGAPKAAGGEGAS